MVFLIFFKDKVDFEKKISRRQNPMQIFPACYEQGFSLASAIGHSPKIVPDVRDFAVQFGQFVRDDFRKHTLYGYAQ